jgi:beta-lactamase regulating signal transducer with metallopeptidase domain
MNMSTLIYVFNAVSDRAAEIAVAALWQGVLVAGALAVCMRLAPRIAAAYRFSVWATAFVALVYLSIFSLIPQLSTAGAMGESAVESATRPWLSLDARWSSAIVALWLVASLYRVVDLAIHSLRLRNLWKDAEPVAMNERVEALLATIAADYDRGPVEVYTTTSLQRPSVIGFFKPRILIPDWLFGRLTHGELEQIVLHEAEHLRRRDDWTNLAQKLCLALFPLNPALVWIERRLCREREMACDDGVIRVTRAPRAYAACLASIAQRGLERRVEALSLGAWQRRPELVHRVHSILRGKSGLSPIGARVLLGTLGCGLLAGSVELSQTPQLVAFVPELSVNAVNATNKPDVVTTRAEKLVQVSSVEREKPRIRGTRVVPSPASDKNDSPVAPNITLREPSVSSSVAVPVMAKTDRRDAKNTIPQDQQWLVLTEWVETSNNKAGLRSDYDNYSDAGRTGDASEAADARQGGKITVTQLIFRIMPLPEGLPASAGPPASAGLPATSGATAYTNSKSASKTATGSSISQPGIASFHDGWLVLQL